MIDRQPSKSTHDTLRSCAPAATVQRVAAAPSASGRRACAMPAARPGGRRGDSPSAAASGAADHRNAGRRASAGRGACMRCAQGGAHCTAPGEAAVECTSPASAAAGSKAGGPAGGEQGAGLRASARLVVIRRTGPSPAAVSAGSAGCTSTSVTGHVSTDELPAGTAFHRPDRQCRRLRQLLEPRPEPFPRRRNGRVPSSSSRRPARFPTVAPGARPHRAPVKTARTIHGGGPQTRSSPAGHLRAPLINQAVRGVTERRRSRHHPLDARAGSVSTTTAMGSAARNGQRPAAIATNGSTGSMSVHAAGSKAASRAGRRGLTGPRPVPGLGQRA
jgi:hypothetical protein